MKKNVLPLLLISFLFGACNNAAENSTANSKDSVTTTVDPAKDWKLGIALWTFHTFNFPESLDKVDSAGVNRGLHCSVYWLLHVLRHFRGEGPAAA